MSKLPPIKYLAIGSTKDLEEARKLPLAVVLQKGKKVTVYKVESTDAQTFFECWDDFLMPSFDSVEYAAKKIGKKISNKSFINASVVPAQTGAQVPGNKEYAIYRARFEDKNKKLKS